VGSRIDGSPRLPGAKDILVTTPALHTAAVAVLAVGGTMFHAGPLSSGPPSPERRVVGLNSLPHRVFPARASRATVAAAMLDEAENPRYLGAIAVPLER
jgi:hypothetical protein